MENIKLMNFTELTLEQKEMVLIWRNSSEIRKWMYNQEEIELNDVERRLICGDQESIAYKEFKNEINKWI